MLIRFEGRFLDCPPALNKVLKAQALNQRHGFKFGRLLAEEIFWQRMHSVRNQSADCA